ncbi:alpha-methylacyl-CoA racemase [Belonocnema kinseyi]|uniref:alpha-methylacyl-CoA racemase n=1 Tax=Belonocnema kinseyi TaxID=2817044 RepID=UPI00143DE9FB|nr:alpha-methylacyl-CoA racemase [Belonocnema kinseyi]XP_033229445.1 alpha-methylacyl-CoA racemase [Belonocnema kinseyi]XP_033229446.1 alpha-methylacyl-CoA racemase [Belonocnema kinseyi]XP_033229447.1 alpha-methylacyl-CoA racemase [Belonocnema kinseyi]
MPLKGIKVIEMAGLAPGPFCGMILADFGASVIRVDRPEGVFSHDCLGNGKRSIVLNLKSEQGAEILKKLTSKSDVIIDPFRRGVMEKLNLGPKDLMPHNKKLIYARLTGYGQDGPFADRAGHDINYLSLSGLLSLFGRHKENLVPPVNLASDFGGGGLMCALGIILALFERSKTQLGQIIDANMVEGSAYLGSWLFRSHKVPGIWGQPRGQNLLDTGTHFYNTYETKDGQYMSVGAIEPQFYAILLKKLCLNEESFPHFYNFEESKEKFSKIFKEKTQKEWCEIFDGSDACVTPVLTLDNVKSHPHNSARGTFSVSDEVLIPKTAPGLSRTPGISSVTRGSTPEHGEHTIEVLSEYGFSSSEIKNLVSSGIVHSEKKQAKL